MEKTSKVSYNMRKLTEVSFCGHICLLSCAERGFIFLLQVGCKMGCNFCATGSMGFRGNLSSGEIIEQLVHASRLSEIRNIVFMVITVSNCWFKSSVAQEIWVRHLVNIPLLPHANVFK